jgi:hypothetical protein
VERSGVAIGILAIVIGLAVGYAMIAFPEGTNPAYPIWIALLAPLAFILGGVLICAHTLGRFSMVAIAFGALAFCLLAIVTWGAFSSSHIQCRETLSFLGLRILERYPNELECRAGLRVIMACLDAGVLVVLAVSAWHRWAGGRRESTK